MIAIIEGLDGTGKTTICKQICELDENIEYIHGSYTDSNQEKIERLKTMFNQLFDTKLYLYDRCTIIDDFVYNFLDSQRSPLLHYKDIIKAILKKCIKIHLIINENERHKRFIKRGDDMIDNKMIKIISENYVKFYKDFECNVILYSLSNDVEQDARVIYYSHIKNTNINVK